MGFGVWGLGFRGGETNIGPARLSGLGELGWGLEEVRVLGSCSPCARNPTWRPRGLSKWVFLVEL